MMSWGVANGGERDKGGGTRIVNLEGKCALGNVHPTPDESFHRVGIGSRLVTYIAWSAFPVSMQASLSRWMQQKFAV